MIIKNDTLVRVNNSDIVNGTFVFPNNITKIGDRAFSDCIALKSIEIPNSVTIIGDFAFWYCISLTSVKIPNSVTRITKGAFYECTSLTKVEIPNSVTRIGYGTFKGCKSLTKVEIPNSVEEIDDIAFANCALLKSKLGNYKILPKELKCRGFQYEIGEWYEEDDIKLCHHGFHFCTNAFDLFNYYHGKIGDDVRVFKVDVENVSNEMSYDSKKVCRKIKLAEEIYSFADLLNS